MKSSSAILLALLGFILLGPIHAAENGKIIGSVADSDTKEPLVAANIIVMGTKLGTASDTDGMFKIENVPAGTYALKISLIGYRAKVVSDIIVNAVKPTQISATLEQSLLEISSVIIKPDYFEQDSDIPVSVQTQSNEEIRRLPGGLEDVVRAVSILPGVAQVQGGRNDLIVRGGAPSENLYIVDGIEVSNINHFGTQGASGGPLSIINLDFVEQTSFSSGGFGVRYGDRLSSVLTIDLMDGRKDQFGGKGTISATQFGVNLEGPLTENGSVLFSARRSYLDFIFKAAGFGFVPEYWDFLTKANYNINDKDRLTFIGISAINNVKLFNDTPEKIFSNSRILYSDQYKSITGFSWQHLLPNGFTRLILGHTFDRFNYQQNDTLRNPIFKNDSFERETSLTASLVYKPAKRTELNIGIQARLVQFDSRMLLASFKTDFGQSIAVATKYDTTTHKAAGWLQLEQSLYRFVFTLGLRMDYNNLINEGTVLSPRFSSQFILSDKSRLSMSAGRYRQAPALIWIVANPINRDLPYITADQYILGLEHLIRPDMKISVETYIKNYRDYPASLLRPYLIMANTGAGFGGSVEGFASFGVDPLINVGTGWSRGAELFIQKKLSEVPIYGLLSITYNLSKFKAFDGISRPSSFDQRWIVNIGGGWVINTKWEVSGKFRYATGRPYTPYNNDLSRSPELYNSARIPANHSLDLRVDRRWSLSGLTFITYLDIQNVYNRPAVDVPVYNVYEKKFETTSTIGLLPSIGISAEF